MILGFYYHSAVTCRPDGLYVPGFLGVFLEALAAQVGELRLFLHEGKDLQASGADHRLSGENIQWVNMGPKTPAWHRSLFHRSLLSRIAPAFGSIDWMLIRSPSPLAPYFHRVPSLGGRTAYMVVSDYAKGAQFIQQTSVRNRMVRLYALWNDRVFKRTLRGQMVIVNSRELLETFAAITTRLHEVKTTTLRENDFFSRVDTCRGDTTRLLFTGRFVNDKGLRELLLATSLLVAEGRPVETHLVGWEDDPAQPVQSGLRELASQLGIADRIQFHGRKRVGDELNAMYRMADVYVLPSYHEGFPRTIWEAMANALPVVSTTVGSIPRYLQTGTHALLVAPKDSDALAGAIRRLILDSTLRHRLIQAGQRLAGDNLVDRQAERLVKLLIDEERTPTPQSS